MLNKKAVINNSLFYLQNYYKYRIREITQTLFLFIVKTLRFVFYYFTGPLPDKIHIPSF